MLVHSHLDDPVQKIMFVDRHWVRADGGGAVAVEADANVYLALSLRNAGAGIAVLQGLVPVGGLAQVRGPRPGGQLFGFSSGTSIFHLEGSGYGRER